MTLIAALPASSNLLAQLANPAARALALAVAAALALLAFRVKSTSVRLFTWTAVLYAALAMPLLGRILPPLPIPAPLFLQHAFLQHALGWRSASIAAIKPLPSVKASASEALEPNFSAGSPAAERQQNAAHGVSRGESAATIQPQRGERPALGQTPTHAHNASSSAPGNAPPDETSLASSPAPFPPLLSSIPWSSIPWTTLAAALYLSVASLLLARFFIGLAFTRRLLRASRTIDAPRLTQKLAAHACASRLNSIPHAAESEFISVPVTVGALRSTILLPATCREWDDPKLDAVLAHEISHVARRDALTQRLSLLHRALFWFSPLAWWLNRHLADLAEQASDEAALSGGADRSHYARVLLGFFEALQAAPGRVWWQGVSMAKASQAEPSLAGPSQVEQRLERILSWKGSVAMRLHKSIALAVFTLAIPVVYLAASARPVNIAPAAPQHPPFALGQAQDQTPPPAPRSEPAPKTEPAATPEPTPASEMTPPAEPDAHAQPAPAAMTGTITGIVPPGPIRPIVPIAPVSPITPPPYASTAYPPYPAMAPRSPMPPAARQDQSTGSGSSHSRGRGYSYHYGYDDNQRFVIVSGKTDSLTMSGDMDDAHHVEKLRKQIPGDFIWFQRDEKSYIVRDQATIDRARKFWEPQEELGKKQEELGKQQEALGKQQEELGAKMEQVQVNVPDVTAELDKLKAKLQKLGAHATMDQIGDLQSEIGELQSKIGEIQSQAGEQQGKLGEMQGALGEKQGKLGEQQGELGRQQGELAEKATHEMKQLLDEAIKNGTAQPEL